MKRIALCSGDPALRQQGGAIITSFLKRYSDSPGPAAVFDGVPGLLDAVEGGEDFSLYIFDALRPGHTGLDLCVRLRELGGRGAIIRLIPPGGSASFMDQAVGRLCKPLEPEAVFRELSRVLDYISLRQSAKASVGMRGGPRVLLLSELLYVDLQNRVLRYHALDGSTAASTTLRISFQKAIAPLLSDGRFFRCGTSLAVNLHHVRGVATESLLLDSGGTVPLTPGMSGEARRRWASYWRGDPMAETAPA